MNMKNFNPNKFLLKGAACFCILASMVFAGSCHKAKADDDNPVRPESADQRPDSALAHLLRSIADGDARNFASAGVYPIERKYPLRSIEDSATMVDYFPVLVDDSLKKIAAEAKTSDWNFYGWRGWALGDSAILWFDDGLQFVDYESKAETGLRKMLARDEIKSLPPQYREGWTPVITLVETDGGRIFRIDSNSDDYRLMEYENEGDIPSNPTLVLVGTLDSEGSAEYRMYVFSDSTGIKAEYMPDAEPPVTIDISKAGKPLKSHKVRRGYWRDHLRR